MLDEKGQANPTVSILIPYYNDERFLRDSIESVLRQTYKDFELILINHACTDSSRKIARSFDDKRIVHIDLPTNAGAGGGIIVDAFLKVARGKYVKLFCADDLLHDNCIEKCLDYLAENPKIDFCFANEAYIDAAGKLLPSNFYEERTKHILEADDRNYAVLNDFFMCKSNPLPFSSCLIKRECFDNFKNDFTMVMLFDVGLFCQFLLNGKNIGFINETLVDYRIHAGQTSSSVNEKKICSLSFFEMPVIVKLFFETQNLHCLQRLLNRTDLNSLEELRLELAKRYLNSNVIPFQTAAYEWLHDYFQDKSRHADGKYSIAQFRSEYGHSNAVLFHYYANSFVDIDGMGVKGIFKLLLKKCLSKILPKAKNRLSHL